MATATRFKPYTFDDFSAIVREDQKADLIDGVIHVASPDNVAHFEINSWYHAICSGIELPSARMTKTARNRPRIEWLQLPEPGRREVAGEAVHTEAVGAVRRHLDVEDGVAETGIARILRSQRSVLRQLDDPLVVIAQTELVG